MDIASMRRNLQYIGKIYFITSRRSDFYQVCHNFKIFDSTMENKNISFLKVLSRQMGRIYLKSNKLDRIMSRKLPRWWDKLIMLYCTNLRRLGRLRVIFHWERWKHFVSWRINKKRFLYLKIFDNLIQIYTLLLFKFSKPV